MEPPRHGSPPRGAPARAYGLLLYLYPDRFRRSFGPEMVDAFGQMVQAGGACEAWRAVARELIPSLAREHAADAAEAGAGAAALLFPILFPLRVLLAVAVPALAYAWLVRHAARAEDVTAATLWFAAVAAGVARARGRGWASAAGAVAGATAAMGALLVYDAAYRSANVLSVAPLLLAASAAAAFVLATFVRVLVEGVDLRRPAPSAVVIA